MNHWMKSAALAAMMMGMFAVAATAEEVVDLRGVDTDKPVQSPSLQNAGQLAGQAPGGPIEADESEDTSSESEGEE